MPLLPLYPLLGVRVCRRAYACICGCDCVFKVTVSPSKGYILALIEKERVICILFFEIESHLVWENCL